MQLDLLFQIAGVGILTTVVVVAKAHGLAGLKGIERAEDGRVAESFRDTARIKGVNALGGQRG